MGWLGTEQLAGHQVALNLASLTFMVPLGVGAAAAVLVGNSIGRHDPDAARRHAGAALVCGTAFMVLSAITFIAIPARLASLYTTQASVLVLAAQLIPVAGVFQIFDGLQVVSGGILRGAGDTRVPMFSERSRLLGGDDAALSFPRLPDVVRRGRALVWIASPVSARAPFCCWGGFTPASEGTCGG